MFTTPYRLRSDSTKTVSVPLEWADIAQEVVDRTLTDIASLAEEAEERPYLGNAGILTTLERAVKAQQGTPEHDAALDELYLRICVYGTEQARSTDDHRHALEVGNGIIRVIEALPR